MTQVRLSSDRLSYIIFMLSNHNVFCHEKYVKIPALFVNHWCLIYLLCRQATGVYKKFFWVGCIFLNSTININKFTSWVDFNPTGGQLYNDTSLYEVSEYIRIYIQSFVDIITKTYVPKRCRYILIRLQSGRYTTLFVYNFSTILFCLNEP